MPDRNDDKTPEQPSNDAAPAAAPPSPAGQPPSVAQSDAPTEAIPVAPKQMTVRPVPARPAPLPVPPPPRAPAPRRIEPPAEPAAQETPPPPAPEQPATEAISVVEQFEPEPEPEYVPPPVEAVAPKPPPPPVAKPQRVLPTEPPPVVKKKRGKWLAALLVAVAAVAVAIVLVSKAKDTGPTADDQIRSTINEFAKALTAGDIQKLRTTSCGPLSDYYRNIPDNQFADIYKASVEQNNIPVIQSIDAIQVTDNTAIAQVTAYTNADPATKSARTFNLENTDQGWKVCDPPT